MEDSSPGSSSDAASESLEEGSASDKGWYWEEVRFEIHGIVKNILNSETI